MKKNNVCLFLPTLNGGGAERIMIGIANGLSQIGLNVTLLLGNSSGPLKDIINKKVKIVSWNVYRTVFSFPKLLYYLYKEQPVAIFSTMSHCNVLVLMANLCCGKQSFTFVREATTFSQIQTYSFWQNIKLKIIKYLMKILYPTATKVIGVSKGVTEDLSKCLKLDKKHIITIYNPIDLHSIRELATYSPNHSWYSHKKTPIILNVGRLHSAKDHRTLILAFHKVRTQLDVKLVILGEGSERSNIQQLIEALQLTEHVSLIGFQNNPYPFFEKSDLFVLSSKREGFPNCLVEAMACGLNVVSTNCRNGPSEILENGRWGKLVEVGNITAMSDAIIELLSHPISPDLLKRRANCFSFEKQLARYYELANNSK